MHSARGYGEYGPCVSYEYCDCPNRLSKVGSPRASSCLPNLVTSVRRAARPSTSARARTPTAAQTHRRPTSGQCTVVLKYRARRLGGFPFRQLEGEADGETGESREGRRSLPHRLHGRTREAMAGAVATRRQPGKVRGLETALAESACSAAGCRRRRRRRRRCRRRRRRRRVAPQMESEIERLGFGCRIV